MELAAEVEEVEREDDSSSVLELLSKSGEGDEGREVVDDDDGCCFALFFDADLLLSDICLAAAARDSDVSISIFNPIDRLTRRLHTAFAIADFR